MITAEATRIKAYYDETRTQPEAPGHGEWADGKPVIDLNIPVVLFASSVMWAFILVPILLIF